MAGEVRLPPWMVEDHTCGVEGCVLTEVEHVELYDALRKEIGGIKSYQMRQGMETGRKVLGLPEWSRAVQGEIRKHLKQMFYSIGMLMGLTMREEDQAAAATCGAMSLLTKPEKDVLSSVGEGLAHLEAGMSVLALAGIMAAVEYAALENSQKNTEDGGYDGTTN